MPVFVSVILPAYNASTYLQQTIDSVICQTYTNWELILINDGSTDNTGSIMMEYPKKDPRIIYIEKSNSGVSASRNEGIRAAKGEILFFLDADDIWNENNIEKKLHFISETGYDAVYSDCLIINEKSETCNRFLRGSNDIKLEDILIGKGNYTTAPSGIAVKRTVADKTGGFDVHLSNNADTDFFIQILASGFRIGYINEVLWKYRVHEKNMSKNISLLEKDLIYLYNKVNKMNMFNSNTFKRKCFARVYFVLAGSWWKNGDNKLRGIYFLLKAFFAYPPSLFKIFIGN